MDLPKPPTHTTNRLEYVDALRGFALIGVLGANLFIFSGFDYMTEAQRAALPTAGLDKFVYLLELIFVENKFMGLFAFLFGVSFWLFLDRLRQRGVAGTGLFYRRLLWLFLFGAIHGWLCWCFDILRFYALWGLLLPLFMRVPKKTLLSAALFCAVLAPALVSGFRSLLLPPSAGDSTMDALALQAFSASSYVGFLRVNWLYDWHLTLSVGQIAYQVAVLGRLLLGLYAARTFVLSDLRSHYTLFRKVLIVGAVVGLLGNFLIARRYFDSDVTGRFFLPFCGKLVAELGYLGLTLAYAAGLVLLFQQRRWVRVQRLFAPVGRMALTCYLLQTLFGLWLFYGFMPGPGLMGLIGPVWLLPIWCAEYVIQMWFAAAWLRRFRFGPAEWLWRSLTYSKIQPFRIAEREAG